MWVVVHVCSGLALGTALHAPLVALLPLSLVLHALLDLVPHWDYTRHQHRRVWAAIDLATAVLLTALLWAGLDLPLAAVLTGWVSAAPDLDVLNEVLPLAARRRFFPSHWNRFPHGRCRAAIGIPVQLAVIAASLWLVAVASG